MLNFYKFINLTDRKFNNFTIKYEYLELEHIIINRLKLSTCLIMPIGFNILIKIKKFLTKKQIIKFHLLVYG
jgi:hypothetical protein